ncbi:unnamed protein product [Parascedosporium putredinis]|uniref:C-type lectin domain-containing protein n=1 Tax=Parascedosporium putredinis TaxID=1442378 RepID=A0A9P1GZZ1_9PEZI|nr:unnamed protein product [Parascedosporium putredinis]CAI7993389.1 unnamed protein product [Parascedosporium putredinis]
MHLSTLVSALALVIGSYAATSSSNIHTATATTLHSTVIAVATPLAWFDAYAYCQQIGHTIYPVPATPTDPVLEAFEALPGDRYWVQRRTGQSCTCLSENAGSDMVEEAPCGDLLPFFCKDCTWGGDGC